MQCVFIYPPVFRFYFLSILNFSSWYFYFIHHMFSSKIIEENSIKECLFAHLLLLLVWRAIVFWKTRQLKSLLIAGVAAMFTFT
jgi:hypothetical protein